MIRFSIPFPRLFVRWLFPTLLERAERYGKARQSRRSKRGIFEIEATAKYD